MNRLAQFLQYSTKVFDLKDLLRRVRDGRVEPKVPLLPLVVCLVLGVVTRVGSYLDLAQQTKNRRRWRHLCGLKAAVQHEIILIFGFALFSAFALHSQSVRVGEMTLKALAHQLDLALEADVPWNLWFHCG